MTAVQVIEQAEDGDPVTQYNIGMMYLKSKEIKYREKKNTVPYWLNWRKEGCEQEKIAYHWLMKAAEQGHSEASYEVGLLLLGPPIKSGHEPWDEAPFYDEKEALKWFVKAAEQGNEDAKVVLERLTTALEDTKERHWFLEVVSLLFHR